VQFTVYLGLFRVCFVSFQPLAALAYVITKNISSVFTCCVAEWHLATQVLYFVGVFLVLFCEIFARVQLCCRTKMVIYRTIGFMLLSSCTSLGRLSSILACTLLSLILSYFRPLHSDLNYWAHRSQPYCGLHPTFLLLWLKLNQPDLGYLGSVARSG